MLLRRRIRDDPDPAAYRCRPSVKNESSNTIPRSHAIYRRHRRNLGGIAFVQHRHGGLELRRPLGPPPRLDGLLEIVRDAPRWPLEDAVGHVRGIRYFLN